MAHRSIPYVVLTSVSLSASVIMADGPRTSSERNGDAARPTDDRQVTQQQLRCVRDSFMTYFHGGSSTTSHTAIVPAQVDVSWSSLRSKVDAVSAGGDTLRGVRIHYGLKAASAPYDYRFSIAVEIVRLLPLNSGAQQVFTVRNAFYTVGVNTELKSADPSTWGDDEVYFERGFVRRTSATTVFSKLNSEVDTRNFLFPWEGELRPLHDDNTGCDAIRFVCITEPGERDGGVDLNMRHHLCAVALHGTAELVNDDAIVSGHPFRNKGADIGNPCPARCGNAEFPEHGTPLRNCP